mmetsp:Transcript_4636/g.13587  ORF Transcript_4636/g.13587 Transcript_4636/m.13587 type:complete len:209 (-) Transcript_4636:339-965(-)
MLLACLAIVPCARARPSWVDDLMDPLPVLSQVKTVYHFTQGERQKAVSTQDRFTKRCPGLSQLRSLLEITEGNINAARSTQAEFLAQPGEFVKNFVARESIKEAEILGIELKNQAMEELEVLMEDAIKRLPTQSKSFFLQSVQTFTAMLLVFAIFQSSTACEVGVALTKGIIALGVLIFLDVALTAALEDVVNPNDGDCCPCNKFLNC